MNYQEYAQKHPQLISVLMQLSSEFFMWKERVATVPDEKLPTSDITRHLSYQILARQQVEQVITDLILTRPLSLEKAIYWSYTLDHTLKPYIGGALDSAFYLEEKPSEEHLRAEKIVRDWSYNIGGSYKPYLEECVQQIDELNWITINSYNCKILNSKNLVAIDIDYSSSGDKSYFSRREALELLPWAIAEHKLQARLYSTFAGFRLLLTDRTLNPKGSGTMLLMIKLGADEKYSRLCQKQDCYRMRLTPKPWRTSEKEVCKLILDTSIAPPLPELAKLIAIHDSYTLS